ncbi:hypothetical protein OJAV_G00206640 [Oryzias javanicus]|uniref:Uncharacterized protein n=1 Tax=Oryzias javanicus TaxID=123683 RepID=A0A3S2PCZ4_ORYJA|nr:hypothetical protein OJAV_G00206640 [Oryzias javanicus]
MEMCPGEAPPCPGDISRSSAAFLREPTADHTQPAPGELDGNGACSSVLAPFSSWDKTRQGLLHCQISWTAVDI